MGAQSAPASRTTSHAGGGKREHTEILAMVAERIRSGSSLRKRLSRGIIRIDRRLPFLCVYRRPPSNEVTGTERLVTGEASYLIAPGERGLLSDLRELVELIVEEQSGEFGAFLLLEIWAGEQPRRDGPEEIPPPPGFTIVTPKKGWPQKTVDRLRNALDLVRLERQNPVVRVERREQVCPPGMLPLLKKTELKKFNCWVLGVEVDPVYLNPDNGEIYPQRLLRLRRSLGRALKKTWHEFTRTQTDRRPPHFHALGPNAVTRAVWEVDERIATIDHSFELLLNVTPVNPESAYRKFMRERNHKAPNFLYRPLEVDPELLKRGLFNIPIERVEDPTLAHLFREKQEELDRQITLLRDRNTANFRYEGLQLYGRPSAEGVGLARKVLEILPYGDEEEPARGKLNAAKFAAMAMQEYEYYHSIYPEFRSTATVRDDINRGLMVSQGNLLIGKGTAIPKNRADALLQHEVGTHVLTFCNGRAQPLRQLYCGLAGYDEFQEGIAVLAEYLVGGLTPARLRLLAMRIVGVDAMLEGATFVDVFSLLHNDHGFTKRSAFTIAMRIFRGGGFAKDAVYLRGFQRVLDYLRDGGDVRLLFVGKLAAHHVPIVRELQYRNVLREAPLTPRYLTDPVARERLGEICNGRTILEIAEEIGGNGSSTKTKR